MLRYSSSSTRQPPPRWAPQTRWSLRRARRVRAMIQFTALVVVFLVILPCWILYKPPSNLISYFATKFPDVLFHLPTSQKLVALTIDDVPTQYTHQILTLLQENNATATFFVIGGQIDSRESSKTLVDIVKSGNELGNHAMHDEPSVRLSSEVLTSEIAQVDSAINKAYSQAGRQRSRKLFRPGSGFFSRRILDLTAEAGYETILGDIFPHDPFISSWRINAWHILSSLRPGGIIIIHDRRSWTIPMLQKVLPAIKRQGYEITTVSEALARANG